MSYHLQTCHKEKHLLSLGDVFLTKKGKIVHISGKGCFTTNAVIIYNMGNYSLMLNESPCKDVMIKNLVGTL